MKLFFFLMASTLILGSKNSNAMSTCSSTQIKVQIDGVMGYHTDLSRPILLLGSANIGDAVLGHLNQIFWPNNPVPHLTHANVENQPVYTVIRLIERHLGCR